MKINVLHRINQFLENTFAFFKYTLNFKLINFKLEFKKNYIYKVPILIFKNKKVVFNSE